MRKTDKLTLTFEELEEYLSQVWSQIRDCEENVNKNLDAALLDLGHTLITCDYNLEHPAMKPLAEKVKRLQGQKDVLEEASTMATARISEIIKELDAEETKQRKKEET
jgi:signal recognition particle GTPase